MSLHVVVMGVAGSGKTTVGKLLAQRLGCPYAEADDFHPASNVAKMAAGIPLDDEDRAPWLEALSRWLDAQAGDAVVTCSALKRAYREHFRDAQLVFLRVSREVLAERLAERVGHFMPLSLLGSQLATLEEPSPEEDIITVEATQPADALVETILRRLEERVARPARRP